MPAASYCGPMFDGLLDTMAVRPYSDLDSSSLLNLKRTIARRSSPEAVRRPV